MAWFGGDEPGSPDTMETAVSRLKTLMGLPDGPRNATKELQVRQSRYGLGDRRSLDQFIAFSGIDTINRHILDNRCGNIEYVPFVEHPLGPDYIPKFDPVTEEYADKWYEGSVFGPGSTAGNLLPEPLKTNIVKPPVSPPFKPMEPRLRSPPVSSLKQDSADSHISLVQTKKIFELPLQSVPAEELITGSTLVVAVCVVMTIIACLLRKPITSASTSDSTGASAPRKTTKPRQPEFSKNV